MTLKPHEPLDSILLSKSSNEPLAVLPHPPRQVRRNPGIKGAVRRSRQNVHARQLSIVTAKDKAGPGSRPG
jgi:hypothetical protein